MHRDLIITVLARFFGIGSGLITSIATAQYLGVEGRGVFFIIVTAATLVMQIANLGMPASVVYYVAKHDVDLAKVKGNAFAVTIIVGTLASIAIGFYYTYTSDIKDSILPLLIFIPIVALPQLFFMIISNVLIGQRRILLYNIIQIIFYSLVIGGYLSVIAFDAGLQGFLAASGITSAICLSIVLYNLNGKLKGILKPDWAHFKETFKFSFKAYTNTIVGFLLLRISVFIMQAMTSTTEMGLYSIAAQIGDTLSILPQSFAMILFPRLLKDITNSTKMMIMSLGILSVLMFIACSVTYFIVPWFIEILFGEAFSGAASVTKYMLPGIFFLSLITVLTQYLASHGYPWACLYIWIFGLIITVTAGFYYIPLYKAIGGAISLSIGYFIVLLGFSFLTFMTIKNQKRNVSL